MAPSTPPSPIPNNVSYSMELVLHSSDLLTEILLRLPVKSLVKFQSVRREWLSLISSHHFRCLKLQQQSLILQGELVLLHCHGGIKYLSFLSRPHMSPKDFISLPFYEEEDEISGNSCRGLFYFDNFEGKAVVCNLTTNEFKLLLTPPPNRKAFFYNSGLGYNPKSDDYKVIRNYRPGCDAEVYSLKSDSWKVIVGPGNDIRMSPECGVYLDGSCYWIVCVYVPEAGIRAKVQDFILSFNFTTETFFRLPLPPIPRTLDLFDCDSFLGVVGFKEEYDYKTRVAKHLELWVCREGSWARLFGGVLLLDVERPLGVKDARFLFLEGKSSCK